MINLLQNEVSIAIASEEEVFSESERNTSKFDFVHEAFRGFASGSAFEINEASRIKLIAELEQGRLLVDAKEKLTRRGEFSRFKQSLAMTRSDITRAMRFFETFGGWAIEKILVVASATNIFSLLALSYSEVVTRLTESTVITKELVQGLVKEVRDRAKVSRQQKKAASSQATSPQEILQQHFGLDGSCYFTLKEVNLSEEIGKALLSRLENQSIGQVIAEAVQSPNTSVALEQIQQEFRTALDKMRLEHQQELTDVISEVREKQACLQRQIAQRDAIITELEAKIANCAALSEPQGDRNLEQPAAQRLKVGAWVLLKISPALFSSPDDGWEVVGIRGTKISVSLRGQGKPVITDSDNVAKVLPKKNQ